MKNYWFVLALVMALMVGAVGGGLLMQAGAQVPAVAVDAGWRYNDGYWHYYDPTDKAYYYTDGRHWYTYGDNNAWSVYNFDRSFGKAYGRQGYVVPKTGTDIVLPRHTIRIR